MEPSRGLAVALDAGDVVATRRIAGFTFILLSSDGDAEVNELWTQSAPEAREHSVSSS